ncbi:MAG: hypothetical protein IPO30_16270 [Hyphomonadaceae bacterium]|nr:hypothetical protein [Hyphomonadaceae bacterium]
MPAGAKIVSTWWYDNTVRNGANPNPKESVIWGDQSWEEMHYASMFYQWNDERVGAEADATDQLKATNVLGSLDANLDEKVELGELRGRVYEAMKPVFANYDADKSGRAGPEGTQGCHAGAGQAPQARPGRRQGVGPRF